jgi:light-regulated signal transduction histidine kinase (bacteriophytochrome)
MAVKPTYEELAQRVETLEKEALERNRAEEALREGTRQLRIAHDQAIIYAQELSEEIAQRKRVEEALRKAQAELERRVEERTAELAKATAQLKVELFERYRIEEALRLAHEDLSVKADDLETANEELSQYDHVVAHVLKAPLRAIQNYTDFLSQSLDAPLSEEQKVYLTNISRAVREGTELVDDLLEYSMVGRRSGPPIPIDLETFLREEVASLQLPPDVEVSMGHDWPTVDADPTLLKQILEHLIANAIKFNRRPLKRVELGWLEAQANDSHCEIFVRDNGIGLEPRYCEQIFQVFERLHTRDEYEGTGLGLAIVKKAIHKLRGSVRVESTPGEGTTFIITLPKTRKEKNS